MNALGALEVELRLDVGGASEHFAALRWIGFVELRRDGAIPEKVEAS